MLFTVLNRRAILPLRGFVTVDDDLCHRVGYHRMHSKPAGTVGCVASCLQVTSPILAHDVAGRVAGVCDTPRTRWVRITLWGAVLVISLVPL